MNDSTTVTYISREAAVLRWAADRMRTQCAEIEGHVHMTCEARARDLDRWADEFETTDGGAE